MSPKTCSKCKASKPLEAFCVDNGRKDGRFPTCKECVQKRQNEKRRSVIPETNPDVTRACTTCFVTKSITEFPIDRDGKHGRRSSCKECERPRKRQQYLDRRASQENTHPIPRGCEICGCKFYLGCKYKEKEIDSPHWDHIHGTEIFRGWLCHSCNTSLGQFGDNYRILEVAAAYLKERGANITRPLIR